MKTRQLGSKGPDLSLVGYGAWEASGHWGDELDEAAIIDAIRAAAEAGINWVDTAEVYGPHTSEEIVGKALDGLAGVLVATKVAPRPAGSGFKRDDVRRACEGSLTRLKRDRIDLYQLHWPASDVPVEETWEAMSELQDEGLAGAIGVSNFNAKLIDRCESIRHVDSIQPQLSMLHRDNLGLIRFAAERGIGVVAYGPLAYGLLAGTITKETTFKKGDWRGGQRGFDLYDRFFAPDALDLHLATLEKLKPIAARYGISIADLAIAWVIHQEGVTSAIAGSRRPSHVRENARAAGIELDARALGEIDAVLTT